MPRSKHSKKENATPGSRNAHMRASHSNGPHMRASHSNGPRMRASHNNTSHMRPRREPEGSRRGITTIC